MCAARGYVDNANQRDRDSHRPARRSRRNYSARWCWCRATGLSVRLEDVADVEEAPAPKFGDAQVNGRSGVVLLAYAQYQANTMVVTRALEAALAADETGAGRRTH